MAPLTRLLGLQHKRERLAVGLMSGMSVDGLDIALVQLHDGTPRPEVHLVGARTVAYEPSLQARIRDATQGTTRDVCALSFELGNLWAEAVLGFLADAGVSPSSVDVLGSHGQTLDHVSAGAGGCGSTLQVGDGDVLAERTGILTVTDFRCRDIAAGGEGAPLVPLADWLLFGETGATLACQNLGSIANVTVVTDRVEDVRAFDTGPANALVDGLARHATRGASIDQDGEISAEGRVHEPALAQLRAASAAFLERPPPKSAGFDDFGPALADAVASAHPSAQAEDLVRTAVEFTAETLAQAYERFVMTAHPELRRVLVTGGGARNPTLMGRIEALLGSLGLVVEVPTGAWVEMKEAVAFALLADRTARGLPGNAPGATGARRPTVLGKISL